MRFTIPVIAEKGVLKNGFIRFLFFETNLNFHKMFAALDQ